MGRGKAKEKEAQCLVVEPLKDLQGRAGSCAERGERGERVERVDRVGPWQWVAVGHLEVHSLLELKGTEWRAVGGAW